MSGPIRCHRLWYTWVLIRVEYLPNGHLIRVGGGTHGAVGEIAREDPDFVDHLLDFMNADFETTKPVTLYQRMPKSVDLPPLKFLPTDGPTMFEQRWGRRKDAAAD